MSSDRARDYHLLALGVETMAGKRGGRPCIINTRIEVEMLHGLWTDGYTFSQILGMYPDIGSLHVLACAIGFWAGVVWAREQDAANVAAKLKGSAM